MLFRQDVGTIIIEDESNMSYETLKKPYISSSKFITEYAEQSGLKLILGSTVLSSSLHLALEQGNALELAPQATKARSTVPMHIIDTRVKKLDPEATAEQKQKFEQDKKPFTAISDELHEVIKDATKSSKKLFILAPRRGLAPLTVCRDCKTPVLCTSCDTPITLRKTKSGEREFLCYKCGESQDSDTTCTYCNSWRLDTLGIGIEMLEAELTKHYKDVPIHKVDKQTTKTDKQVQDAIKAFNTDGGILLGSQLALPHLHSIELSAIASLDAMLSVPNFKIDERVFALILQVKDITKDALYIQSRMPERSALTRAKEGDIATFMREELALRKALKYPPYTVMVKITRIASKRQIIEDFQAIMPSLEPYGPRVFKQFYQITPSKFALHALLRIPKREYPQPKLTDILKNIQPLFEVRVDVG
jgi:primosomal protein N' (replication factor Y)